MSRTPARARKSALDSLDGYKSQPSHFTLYTDRNGDQVRGPPVKNRRVAERALGKVQVDLDEHRAKVAPAKSKTFNEWLPIWQERVESGGRLRAETIRQYVTTGKLAAETFGYHAKSGSSIREVLRGRPQWGKQPQHVPAGQLSTRASCVPPSNRYSDRVA